jgi:hypothetical protein
MRANQVNSVQETKKEIGDKKFFIFYPWGTKGKNRIFKNGSKSAFVFGGFRLSYDFKGVCSYKFL